MEKCEDFYEKDSEYDAGEPKDTKRKLVGKRHVDTSKTTGEHRAQKYQEKIKNQMEMNGEYIEKWRKALEDLILVQQDDGI